jgi:carboxylesterase
MLSLPQSSKESFSLPGTDAGALLLHGFSGTPYEVRLIGDALSAANINVHAPLLPGHGTSPADLNQTKHGEWLTAARAAFNALDSRRPRFLIGCSMGSLLALILAAELQEEINGLVLLAPATNISPVSHLGVLLSMLGFGRLVPFIPKADRGGDIGDPQARALNPTYPSMPLEAVAEFDAIRRKALKMVKQIHVPTCLIHGAKDQTALPESSRMIAEQLSSRWIERISMPNSYHLLALDFERDAVCDAVVRFLLQTAPPNLQPV